MAWTTPSNLELSLRGLPSLKAGGVDQPTCSEVTETPKWLRSCPGAAVIKCPLWFLTSKKDLLGRDKQALTCSRRESNNITNNVHTVADIYKETFLLLHGDRKGKSLLLLAYTHMHAHTGAHCSKLFEELVVLLLNELWMFPKSLNTRQWQHIAKECSRGLGWSDNCPVRQKQKQLTEVKDISLREVSEKLIFNF